MKKSTLGFLFSMAVSSSMLMAQTPQERQEITSNYDLNKLASLEVQYAQEFADNKQKALAQAAIYGWEEFITLPNGGNAELVGVFESGEPIYYATDNREGGITTRTNRVHTGGSAGLDLNGEDMLAGIWDGGRVRETHNLLDDRVDQIDNASTISDHSTHVAGTMVGNGNELGGAAKGMAPEAELWAYSFTNDESEMAAAAANGLLVSNHSYGIRATNTPLWFLGYYDSNARNLDNIAYNAPYYLPVCSAGNDRQSGANTGDGGYDYINDKSCAKNNIVVAAVNEVLNYTGPGSVVMSSFSSWGPTDDGRIKPDISAKGVNMLSSTGTANTSYGNLNGTSMATPNVSGSLVLVQQHHNELYGEYMLSATLRGLALHTADEAGTTPGPDYRFGWGLLNTERAVEVVTNHETTSLVIEEELEEGEVFTLTVEAGGIEDLMASITWTDPAAGLLPSGNEDDPTPSLINDLDIRVSQDGGATFFPWILDVANPTAGATTGDNLVDNFEKIEVAGATGEYIITVSHKGEITNNTQAFSLIVTGIANEEFLVSSHNGVNSICTGAASIDFGIDLSFADGFTDTIDFTVEDLPVGTVGTFDPTSLTAEGETVLTLTGIDGLAEGDYMFKVVATGTSETREVYLTLRITNDPLLTSVELLTPGNNFSNRPTDLTFEWEEGNIYTDEYQFELSLDENFTNVVNDELVADPTIEILGLQYETEYWWRVRAINDCEDGPYSDVYRFVTMAELGISDIEIEGLAIYPNPTQNVLTVEAPFAISSVEIVSILGQTLITNNDNTKNISLDVSSLATGAYFVKVTVDGVTNVKQIIKQ